VSSDSEEDEEEEEEHESEEGEEEEGETPPSEDECTPEQEMLHAITQSTRTGAALQSNLLKATMQPKKNKINAGIVDEVRKAYKDGESPLDTLKFTVAKGDTKVDMKECKKLMKPTT